MRAYAKDNITGLQAMYYGTQTLTVYLQLLKLRRRGHSRVLKI